MKLPINRYSQLSLAAAVAATAMAGTARAVQTRVGLSTTASATSAANPSTLEWNAAANWVTDDSSGVPTSTPAPNGVPANAGSNTYIATNGNNQEVTISSAVPTIDGLYWANVANANAALDVVNNGVLTTSGNQAASFGRSGGTGTGTLNVSGSGSVNIGASGTTTWGTVNSFGELVLGDDSNIAGSTHGVLNFAGNSTTAGGAGAIAVGNSLSLADSSKGTLAYGTVNHSSGVLSVGQGVFIGHDGVGVYNLSGGSLIQTGTDRTLGQAIVVGNGGVTGTSGAVNTVGSSGALNQTGGTVEAFGGVSVANLAGSTGTYTISGGSLIDHNVLSVAATGAVAVSGGYTNLLNTTPTSSTTNGGSTGAFIISGHGATSITAASLAADSATSTLGFQIGNVAGTTLLSVSGAATFSSLTNIDIKPLSGYAPTVGTTFTLLTAASISTLPQLKYDGDAFDYSALSIVTSGGTQSLVDTILEPGDVNADGKVNIADLGALATNYGQSGTNIAGDINHDGIVNIADLGILATNYGYGTSGSEIPLAQALQEFKLSAVPEPTSSALTVLAGAAIIRRRKRSRDR